MIQSKMHFGVVYGLLKPSEIHFRDWSGVWLFLTLKRNFQGKDRALTEGAYDRDSGPNQFDETVDQCQSETGPLPVRTLICFSLLKNLKNGSEILFRDSTAIVFDVDLEALAFSKKPDCYRSSGFREFNGVTQ